jgi:photosystem II stability/assembly factor-like uncharacterized protein
MKKKSNSQSAFVNPRVLVGLAVVLTGLSVALFAAANPTTRGKLGFGPAAEGFAKASRGPEPAPWFWQNPLPQGNDLRGASFIDANTGTAVGYYGTIVSTTDGGNTWAIQTSGTTENLWAVSFPDVNNGTAVGEGGTILRTTDGGDHWVSQTSGTALQLRGVSFTDQDKGTAVGEGGTILRTTNGGNTWVPQSSGTVNTLFGVSFTDATTGTAVGGTLGESTILRTTDGGSTWVSQANPGTVFLFDVSFTDTNTGTAVGDEGTILRTTDGGTDWFPQTSGTTKRSTGFRSPRQIMERFVASNSAGPASFSEQLMEETTGLSRHHIRSRKVRMLSMPYHSPMLTPERSLATPA